MKVKNDMGYKLVILNKAEKEIKKVPQNISKKIIQRIYELQNEPCPSGYKKLTDFRSHRVPDKVCYRVRQSDYRIIYTIEEEMITITVVQVKHRKEVYNS